MKTLSAVAAMAALFAFPVMAQPTQVPFPLLGHCDDPTTIANFLAENYGESLAAIGEIGDGEFVQFWSNPDIGEQSWTFLVTRGDKLCAILSGGANTVLDVSTEPKPDL